MEITGKRIRISPLKLEDAFFMKNWGTHENPLLSDYNLPSLSDEEIRKWYNYKTGEKNRKYYSVFNEGNRFIGYMGIKKIRRIFRDALLGIVFDPNYVNQGYGTEAITAFLEYYFNEMKMKKLYLEVAQFNKRALRCYEKSGFKIIDRYLDEFFDQRIDLIDPYFISEKSSFVIEGGKVYNYIYKMKVDKNTYLKAREEIDGQKLKIKLGQLLTSLSFALDVAENRYFNHSRRTAYIAYCLAKEMELKEEDIIDIYYTSLIHDIGMAGHLSNYTVKEIHFNEDLRKEHCFNGYKILDKLPLKREMKEYILYHHEEWKGTGPMV